MFEFSSKAKQFAIALTVVRALIQLFGYPLNVSASAQVDHGKESNATETHRTEGHV